MTTATRPGVLAIGPPPLPKWIHIARYAATILSLGVLVASCYSVSLLGNAIYGQSGPGGFLIFNALLTMFVLGITIALEMSARHVYCRFAVVAALGLDTILWLVAWAWAASVASTFLNIRKWHNSDKYAIGLAAAASLAALTWMLMITITAGFILACIREPKGVMNNERPNEVELQENKPTGYPQAITVEDWDRQERYNVIQTV